MRLGSGSTLKTGPIEAAGGARVTDVWLTRDFPETFRLRGHVALLGMYE
jgi:hypothetical protein